MSIITCISANNPDVIKYATATGMSPSTVADKIGVWQEEQLKKDKNLKQPPFPTLKEFLSISNTKILDPIERVINSYPNSLIRRARINLISSLVSKVLNLQLEKEIQKFPDINQKQLLKSFTPTNILSQVKQVFQSTLQNPNIKLDDRTKQEYQKVINNFDGLVILSQDYIQQLTGYRLNLSGNFLSEISYTSIDDNINIQDSIKQDIQEVEVTPKEGFQTNWMYVSSRDSLSQEVRAMLARIQEIDGTGNPVKDDLGFYSYLSFDMVYDILSRNLRLMTSPRDLIPTLKSLQSIYPWMPSITNKLVNNSSLRAQFYQNFRKDRLQYWIHKVSYS